MSRRRATIINLAFHYIAIALVLIQGIVLTPLYLKYISTSLFGGWLATGNILAWIQLVDPGVSRVMQQRVASLFGRQALDRLLETIGTGMFLGAILMCLPLLAWPFTDSIIAILDLKAAEAAELVWSFKLALLGTCLMLASFQPAAANLGLQLSMATGLIYVMAGIVSIVVTCLLLFADYGLSSIPLGLLMRNLMILVGNSAWMWAWCHRNLHGRLKVTSAELKTYASLSVFTFVERLAATLAQQAEAFLAATVISPTSATTYVLTGRAFDPVQMAAGRFGPAFLPGLAHLGGEGHARRVVEVSIALLRVVGFVLAVGVGCVVALNRPFVTLWVGPHLFGGQLLTLCIGLAMALTVITGCLAEMIFALGGIGRVEIARLIEGLVKFALQLGFIYFFGLIGLPLGTLIGVLLVGAWYMPTLWARISGDSRQQQYLQLGSAIARIGAMALVGWVVFLVLPFFVTTWTWTRFTLAGIIVGAFFVALGLLLDPFIRCRVQGAGRNFRNHLLIPLRRKVGSART